MEIFAKDIMIKEIEKSRQLRQSRKPFTEYFMEKHVIRATKQSVLLSLMNSENLSG
jgi:hypothetical protein